MAAVDWHTLDASVAGALSSASGDDRAIGADILARLEGLGATYDALYTPAVDSAKRRVVEAYSAALDLWRPAAQASHAQADKAARYCESLQIGAQGVTANPFLIGKTILAPTVPIPYEDPAVALAAASSAATNVVASLTGSDLGGFDFSSLLGTDLHLSYLANGVSGTFFTTFGVIASVDGVAARVQQIPNINALARNGRLVISTAPLGAVADVALTLDSGAALPLLGFTAGQSATGVATQVICEAALPDVRGNAIVLTVTDAADGIEAHYALTATYGSYAEAYDNITPGAAPNLGSSLLLSALVSLGTGRPQNGSLGEMQGGAGGAHEALLARLGAAAAFPATVAAGQVATLTAHQLLLAEVYAEQPVLASWFFQAPIPAGGASTLVPLSSPGLVDVYALEQAVAQAMTDATTWLAEFGWPG